MDIWSVRERLCRRRLITREGCWIWQGHLNPKGYGKITIDGKTERVNRIAWLVFNGSIPDGLYVLHTCDSPACFNPDHLFLGDNLDNRLDRILKGRPAGY